MDWVDGTSLFRLAQKLLLTYLLRPFSTTSRPKRFSSPAREFPSTDTRGSVFVNGHGSSVVLLWRALSRSAASCSCSSTCALRVETTPSNRLNRSSSSASGGFLLLRGARPGPGKTQSILARTQLEHGFFLSHLTLRRRQVTQDRGLGVGPAEEDPLMLPFVLGTRLGGLLCCGGASSVIVGRCRQEEVASNQQSTKR